MNDKAIKVLEYNKIIEVLAEKAGSSMAREVIKLLKPFNDVRAIREALMETSEALSLITHKGPLPLGNFYDIEKTLNLARKGGSLEIRDLLKVLYNINVAYNLVTFIKSDVPEIPIIKEMVDLLAICKDLGKDIDRCILDEDEISDNASNELRTIRRSIKRQNEALKSKMNHILNSSDNKTILQDAIVTIRDGRYVIPVKMEHRAKVPGIVHDQSSSGATLFIEPQAIVDLNNQLRQLEAEEKAEIAKILLELSEGVSENYNGLKNNQGILLKLDIISAKGKLSHIQKAESPNINEEGRLFLKEARHPLIDKDKVVPINMEVGKSYRALIITGPNTGGKTVTLKTCGLLSMMAQTGLHIPASSQSSIPIYSNIYADIGDEQSIEQSLSTFSSHMKNIVNIVENAGEDDLVLLDELGAGTDPTEGAALAISILEELIGNKATVLATTHYTELKKYALSSSSVENASMEFDVESLSPTYKLTIGIPGKSNAFEISDKLGLDSEIITKARHLLEGGDLEFEEVISAIEADKKAAEAERDEAIGLNIEMKKQKEQMDREMDSLKRQKEKTLNNAREEARDIIAEAKEISLEVQAELRELSKLESLGERNKSFDKNRKRIKDAAGRYRETLIKEANDNPVRIEDAKIGDRVKVLNMGQNGEILTLPDDRGELTVQVGMLKVKVKLKELKLINEGKKKTNKSKSNYGSMYKNKSQNVSSSVNVIGQNLDEATHNVEKYIDDALMAGISEITIVHGKGAGILLSGIRDILKKHKHVDSFERGGYYQGGDGVTEVKLK